MEPTALAIAGVAALAIILIAVGIASSGGSGMSDRLERYAASSKPDPAKSGTGQGGVAELISQSQALASLNRVVERRDFGANLARDIARADLKLKPSEFLLIRAGTTIGVPLAMLLLSPLVPTFGNPLFLLIGGFIGFLIPAFWLGRRKSGRLNSFNKQSAGHDHPHRQRAAGRLIVPAGHRTRRARVATTDLDRIQSRHPRGQPRPAIRPGAGEHGSSSPLETTSN